MNEIKHEELLSNLKTFLKSKGIELQEGSYTKRLEKGCEILADSINVSQRTFDRAKAAMDKGLDQLRQTIHEQTAPKSRAAESAPKKKPANTPAGKSSTAKKKSHRPGRRTGKG
jgi:predicted metal-dependent hydrolase